MMYVLSSSVIINYYIQALLTTGYNIPGLLTYMSVQLPVGVLKYRIFFGNILVFCGSLGATSCTEYRTTFDCWSGDKWVCV